MSTASRTAAALGWFGVGLFGVCSVIAAAAYTGPDGESYSPFNHYVSELGSRADSELGALFNAGVVVGALCLLVFLLEIGRRIAGAGGRAAAVRGTAIEALGVLAGIGGALVGFFPMEVKTVHTIVASTYFVSLAGAAALATAWMGGAALPRSRAATALGLITALASLGYFLLYSLGGAGYNSSSGTRPPFALDTVVEWTALIAVMAWVAVVARTVWRTAPVFRTAEPAAVPDAPIAPS